MNIPSFTGGELCFRSIQTRKASYEIHNTIECNCIYIILVQRHKNETSKHWITGPRKNPVP
jgi:hypothetical protein